MTDYPFLVKGRVKKVAASSYTNALDRVLYRHRNIFIQTKHARRMSLIEAEESAKKESKLSKKQRIYVVTDKSGEADFSTTIKTGEIAHSVFVAGKKDKLTEAELAGATKIEDKNVANKPTTSMSGKAVKPAKSIEETRANMEKILASNKKISNVITKAMAKTATKAAAKKIAPAKSNKAKVVGGKATAILDALKKKPSTLAELSKAVDTSEVNVKWYISKLRGAGNDITIDGVKCTLKK